MKKTLLKMWVRLKRIWRDPVVSGLIIYLIITYLIPAIISYFKGVAISKIFSIEFNYHWKITVGQLIIWVNSVAVFIVGVFYILKIRKHELPSVNISDTILKYNYRIKYKYYIAGFISCTLFFITILYFYRNENIVQEPPEVKVKPAEKSHEAEKEQKTTPRKKKPKTYPIDSIQTGEEILKDLKKEINN